MSKLDKSISSILLQLVNIFLAVNIVSLNIIFIILFSEYIESLSNTFLSLSIKIPSKYISQLLYLRKKLFEKSVIFPSFFIFKEISDDLNINFFCKFSPIRKMKFIIAANIHNKAYIFFSSTP